jgi:phage recombination protein Bet
MNTSLAVPGQQQSLTRQRPEDFYTAEQMDIINNVICKGATPAERQVFLAMAMRSGMDPFLRQIYAVFREVYDPATGGKNRVMTIQTGIDGLRLTAQRSGDYQGQALAEWCGEDGVWKDVWLSNAPPLAARVGVFRRGFAQPLYAVATWRSYCQTFYDKKAGSQKPSSQWMKMPDVMLSKCAEALALRKAFPVETCGLYVDEEMEQAGEIITVIQEEEPAKKALPKQQQRVYSQISTGQDKKKEPPPGPVQAELIDESPAPAKESIGALRKRAYDDAVFCWGDNAEAKVVEFLGGPLKMATFDQCHSLLAKIEEEASRGAELSPEFGDGDAPEAY